jgi:tape measure domain-containing protein
MSSEVIVSFKKIGDEDVLKANKLVAKSVADLKKLASTPIETKFAKDQIPQGFDRLKDQVMKAREQLAQFNMEMGKGAPGARKAASDLEHLGITYDKVKGKMKTPLGGNDMLTLKNFAAGKPIKPIDPLAVANKQMAEMRSTAATPIESSAFKAAAGLEYDAIRAKVIAAREQVTKFNQEMGKSPKLNGDTKAIEAAIANTTSKLENLRKLAATPIHSQAFKQMAGNDYSSIQNKVLGARAQLDGKPYKDLGSSASWATNMMGNLRAKMEEMKDKAKDAGIQVGFLGRLLAAMAVRAAVHSMIEFADSFTNLQNKIKTVTEGDGSLQYISKQLNEIAQSSRTSIGSVVTAFTRTSRAVSVLGKSQQETLQFTDTLSKAIQVGGSTATEASNAMIQLSQGMSSGALRGDELRSVLEQLPVVAGLIADKMGVTVGQLRALGAEGKITTDIVFSAINDATEKVNTKFNKMQLTLSQAFVKLGNSMTEWAGKLGGVMSSLANVVDYAASHFDSLVTVVESLALGAIPLLAAKAIPWLKSAWAALQLSFASTPWGFIITSIATLAAAFAPLILKTKVSAEGMTTWGDVMSTILGEVQGDFKRAVTEMSLGWDDLMEAMGSPKPPPALTAVRD